MPLNRIVLLIVIFLVSHGISWADEDIGVEFFEKQIRPVLVKHCYRCHSAAAPSLKGSLRLDSRDYIRKGGESGPALVPGNSEKSLLIEALRHESLKMPPDQRLPDQVIADFEKWIELGAPDPRNQPHSAEGLSESSWKDALEQRRQWWSLQPMTKAEPPLFGPGENVKDENTEHSIDAFIHAKQREAEIAQGVLEEPRVLARRLSLVLTGLPPTPTGVERFMKDVVRDFDQAYEALVDRLLSSPHFGEHWARHWMDVVRFAETHGYEWNHEIRDAWQYRDYLIRAFNQDVSYDQLVREHIAGDLLDNPRINEQMGNESIIGTAFWRFGELGHDNCVEFPAIRFDALDNQIDTFAKAFQGLTISCSRCHDHKLDAISTRDYYALVGVLEGCSQVVHTIDSPERIAKVAQRIREIKQNLRWQVSKVWLTAIDQVSDTVASAISAGVIAGDNSSLLANGIADDKRPRDDPAYILRRFAKPDVDVASLWAVLKQEYEDEQKKRAKSLADDFEVWADFTSSAGAAGWSYSGLGLSSGPSRAGEFTVASDGASIVGTVLPAGFYTNTVSDRLNGSLRSPWLPTGKKFVSLQLVGEGRSMVRTVVDSCALNEFAGGGLEYLAGGSPKWRRFPTSAGSSHRSFVELTTRSDNPRWPDRPGRAGTKDADELRSDRSSFGVLRALLHDSPSAPPVDLKPMLELFEQPQPANKTGIGAIYQAVARDAVMAWRDDRTSDADAHWINWLLSVSLLPNASSNDPELGRLMKDYWEVTKSIPEPRVVAGLADQGDARCFPVLVGGDPSKPGILVPPGYIEVISGASQATTSKGKSRGSGRRQLAEVIADANNPLTARVMVNRVWHHLFGRGIVASTDDFGRMGDEPTHPELLDFMAASFVEDGWSVKRLIRKIVLSKTFRQSSRPRLRASQIDPSNRLLHHYPVHRLDAESIRDAILAVSSRLDSNLYGPSVHPNRREEVDYRKLLIGPLDGDGRRSIYTKVTRMEGPRFLELFDFPIPMATRGNRDRTNVPAQALAMLNDPFVIDQSKLWAEQLVALNHQSVEERVQAMFQIALGRPPKVEEQQRFSSMVRQLAGQTFANDAALLKDLSAWQDTAHAVFNMKELIYIR